MNPEMKQSYFATRRAHPRRRACDVLSGLRREATQTSRLEEVPDIDAVLVVEDIEPGWNAVLSLKFDSGPWDLPEGDWFSERDPAMRNKAGGIRDEYVLVTRGMDDAWARRREPYNRRVHVFRPGVPYRDHYRALRKMGFDRHEADCLAREYVVQALKDAMSDDYEMLVATVGIVRCGVELGGASVGGIGFNGKESRAERDSYLREVFEDLVAEALHDGRRKLGQLTRDEGRAS